MNTRLLGTGQPVKYVLAAQVAVLLVIAAAVAVQAYFSDVTRTSWRLAAPPSGNELQLLVRRGACDRFARFVVQETDRVVRIEAYIHQTTWGACPAVLLSERKTLTLRAPLGTRELQGCNPPSTVYGWIDLADTGCAVLGGPRE